MAVRLSIDEVEDAMRGAGLAASWETGVAAYEAVRAAAEQNLTLGWAVVVDAVNDSEAARDTWRRAARTTNAELVFVMLHLDDEEEHRRRLENRARALTHVEEPTWDEVHQRAAAFAAWGGDCWHVSADGTVSQVADDVMRRVANGRRSDG